MFALWIIKINIQNAENNYVSPYMYIVQWNITTAIQNSIDTISFI